MIRDLPKYLLTVRKAEECQQRASESLALALRHQAELASVLQDLVQLRIDEGAPTNE